MSALSPAGPEPESLEDARARLAVLIEAMTEEQVALLADDLVEILARRARGHESGVPSESP